MEIAKEPKVTLGQEHGNSRMQLPTTNRDGRFSCKCGCNVAQEDSKEDNFGFVLEVK